MSMLTIITPLILALTYPSVPPRPAVALPDSTRSTWQIDVTHSDLSFSVRHIFSRVRGQFTRWAGTIQADPHDWHTASVTVTVQAASIVTQDDERDTNLRGPDFLDAARFPTITFVSTSVLRHGDSVRVTGRLTMHGVTKPLVLVGTLAGMRRRKTGKYEAAFDATATVNRTDYGMVWNRVVEGGKLVGDEVTIDLSIAAIQQ